MLFFIGLVAFGACRAVRRLPDPLACRFVAGMAGAGAIRLHVAALLAVAIAAAIFLTRRPGTGPARVRRVVMLGLAGVAVVLLITLTSETFGIDPSGNDLDPFLDEIQRRTQQGGSAVEGEAVRGIAADPRRHLAGPVPSATRRSQLIPGVSERLRECADPGGHRAGGCRRRCGRSGGFAAIPTCCSACCS